MCSLSFFSLSVSLHKIGPNQIRISPNYTKVFLVVQYKYIQYLLLYNINIYIIYYCYYLTFKTICRLMGLYIRNCGSTPHFPTIVHSFDMNFGHNLPINELQYEVRWKCLHRFMYANYYIIISNCVRCRPMVKML